MATTYAIPDGRVAMAATTYTGTGASLAVANTVNGVNFQPDFVWVKGRSGATDHALYDSVRGTTKDLVSNATSAETTQATGLTAFGSTGFTVGALAKMNTSAATYVGWQWKGGGTAVSNTSGSITSSVSANASAGFSVVTYTGTGAAGTIGHGLGVTPSMIIVKPRSGTGDWIVYTNTTGAGNFLLLDTNAASAASTTKWNNTAPTSSVFSVGIDTTTNLVTTTYVAYCFAPVSGYSAFGSYTGNASADGPFVYLGFRPRYVMLKRSDTGGANYNWFCYDSARDTYNATQNYLEINVASAEQNGAAVDFLSNGFKVRLTSTYWNASGGTFIYMAFAENPFKYSLAR